MTQVAEQLEARLKKLGAFQAQATRSVASESRSDGKVMRMSNREAYDGCSGIVGIQLAMLGRTDYDSSPFDFDLWRTER